MSATVYKELPDEIDYKKLVRNVVLNVCCSKYYDSQSRWKIVSETLGVGSTPAIKLCKMFDRDPDEEITT